VLRQRQVREAVHEWNMWRGGGSVAGSEKNAVLPSVIATFPASAHVARSAACAKVVRVRATPPSPAVRVANSSSVCAVHREKRWKVK